MQIAGSPIGLPATSGPLLFQNRRDRTRTCNLRFWRPLLCQLSYPPTMDPWPRDRRTATHAGRPAKERPWRGPGTAGTGRNSNRPLFGDCRRALVGVGPLLRRQAPRP